jgi:hypothetical protein
LCLGHDAIVADPVGKAQPHPAHGSFNSLANLRVDVPFVAASERWDGMSHAAAMVINPSTKFSVFHYEDLD